MNIFMDDYVVMYQGKKISLEEYLEQKEQEPILKSIKVKKENVEVNELQQDNDYTVKYKGKALSFEDYLIAKEQEAALDCDKLMMKKIV